MKHRSKHLAKQPNYLLIASIAIIVIVGAILLFSGGDTSSEEGLIDQEAKAQQQILEEESVDEPSAVDVIKEEVQVASSKKIGEEGLCEDYFFEQGDILKIVGHSVQIVKIASTGVQVNVDGKNYVVNEEDSQDTTSGLELSIAPRDIIYFGQDDSSNSVQMRVGCDYDDSPYDKYVEKKGKQICQNVYEECQDSFGIDLSE